MRTTSPLLSCAHQVGEKCSGNRGEGEDEGGRGKERTIGGGEEEVGREGSKLCCLSFCTESDSQESTLNEKEMIRHLFISVMK